MEQLDSLDAVEESNDNKPTAKKTAATQQPTQSLVQAKADDVEAPIVVNAQVHSTKKASKKTKGSKKGSNHKKKRR